MPSPTSSVAAAPTFVCLHYWAGSGREWTAVAAELAPEYACLTPDLGGFGEAPAPVGGYSVAAYAEAVANYMLEAPQEVAALLREFAESLL